MFFQNSVFRHFGSKRSHQSYEWRPTRGRLISAPFGSRREDTVRCGKGATGQALVSPPPTVRLLSDITTVQSCSSMRRGAHAGVSTLNEALWPLQPTGSASRWPASNFQAGLTAWPAATCTLSATEALSVSCAGCSQCALRKTSADLGRQLAVLLLHGSG